MSSNDDGHLGAGGAGSDAPLPKRACLGAPPSADHPSRADELRARLPHLAAEQHAAERARTLELIALAERQVLSPAEEVLAIPYLSQRSVMSFLQQKEALSLRTASRASCDAVAEHAWSDLREHWNSRASHIMGGLASWRRCFPRATAANVYGRLDLTDADFVHLRGIRKLNMGLCRQITDGGIAHLSGIHTLAMCDCKLVTDAGLSHLRRIHTLEIPNCNLITDAGLAHLSGIHTLHMGYCELITDAGLALLSGIHTLCMANCPLVTDAGLAHLTGICKLRAYGCLLLTAAGRAKLRMRGAQVLP